ncbi:MAG: hypothetical protein U9R17_19060 [Thermodesulfobacteriota bacterium]|nr:hypothetical protein [Thermodesulfobacteriota bacterium]
MKEAYGILDITVVSTITGRKGPSNINLLKENNPHSAIRWFSFRNRVFLNGKIL